jgi:FkbM family methyltransferase
VKNNLVKRGVRRLIAIYNRFFSFLRPYGINYQQISYSQSGEDLIVKFIFDNVGLIKPTYLDIGAHHPYYFSNTAIFYKNGCRGINIEPDSKLFERFLKYRKNDISLNLGIGDTEEELDFYEISEKVLNTFSATEANRFVSDLGYKITNIRRIKLITIEQIIKKYNHGKAFDFLSIDVEGLDEKIIKSINFENIRPKVICCETISFSTNGRGIKNEGLISHIVNNGYMIYADTNINTIFVEKEFWQR